MKLSNVFCFLLVVFVFGFTACDLFDDNSGNGEFCAEDQLMFDRINALIDNEFYNNTLSNGADFKSTGIAVGIIKDGRTFFFNRGYHESEQRGVANRTPVTENSIFALASVSKTFTGTLLAYLSQTINPSTESPYVNLDDPVSKYFVVAPYVSHNGTEIVPTLAQLASHSSGFRDTTPSRTTSASYRLEQIRQELKNMPYEFEPGSEVEYNGFGIRVLAAILSKAYHGDKFPEEKQFEDLLQELISKPLELISITTDPWSNHDTLNHLALPHEADGSTLGSFLRCPIGGAVGGMFSSTNDMIRWFALLMGESVPANIVDFQKAAIKAFEPINSRYGLGWRIINNRRVPAGTISPHPNNTNRLGNTFTELFPVLSNSRQIYGTTYSHSGSTTGYRSYVVISPETNAAVVVLINNAANDITISLAMNILERALNPR